MAELLLGKPLAEKLYAEISDNVKKLEKAPEIAAVGLNTPQWLQYVNSLKKSGEACGIVVESVILSDDSAISDWKKEIDRVAAECDGVLVQQPLPKHLAEVVNFVPCQKDLDCLNSLSVARLYRGEKCLHPATPSAVIKLLEFYGIDLCGKNVTIVGRGNAVGKPLSLMCLQKNATITVCHTRTKNLAACCKNADIVISACGVASLIKADFVSEKTVVVDVGLSFVNGKTCGDVDEEVKSIAAAVSPVPGGVGPVTRAMLFCNLLEAVKSASK